MAFFIGIRPGERKSDSAGANRGAVTLTVAADGSSALLQGRHGGDKNVRLDDSVLVVWHSDSAGTFHGFASPEDAKACKASGCPRLSVGTDAAAQVKGVVAESASGGGCVVGAVVRVPVEGVIVITSDYKGRRGWKYHVVRRGQLVEVLEPAEYRARFASGDEAITI